MPTKHESLPLLNLIMKSDLLMRDKNNLNVLTDVDILKSFRLPLMNDEETYEGSSLGRLLRDRTVRPTRQTWIKFLKTAKDCNLGVEDAADLYFYYLDKQQNNEPVDLPPNITGTALDGLGLSGDEEKKPCD